MREVEFMKGCLGVWMSVAVTLVWLPEVVELMSGCLSVGVAGLS